MKKRLFGLLILMLLTGCVLFNPKASPQRAVADFFSKYQNLEEEVSDQLNVIVADQNLTKSQKDKYKKVMERQYQDLTYTVKDEVINGDNAIVTVEIQVYDYAHAQVEANDYIATNQEQFLDNDKKFSDEKASDYKLKTLEKEKNKAKYTLDLRLSKENKNWLIEDLTEAEKQKIHGVYKGI